MAKKPKQPSRKTLLKEWSKRVREKWNSKCAVCGRIHMEEYDGKKNINDSHHILPKEYYKDLQFDVMDGILLCKKHHKFSSYSFHRNGMWAANWLMKNHLDIWNWVMDHVELK